MLGVEEEVRGGGVDVEDGAGVEAGADEETAGLGGDGLVLDVFVAAGDGDQGEDVVDVVATGELGGLGEGEEGEGGEDEGG